MKRLVAGPFVGEFGWEIMSWQGLVRNVARAYDEVVVCAPSGHEALYADFSTEYIPHEMVGIKDCWKLQNPINKFSLNSLLDRLSKIEGEHLTPYGLVPIAAQKFCHYGNADQVENSDCCDVLIHARMPIGKRPYHSWPLESWRSVIRQLAPRFSIGSIGTQAFEFPDLPVRQFNGASLQQLMNLMAASRLVVGPSSGPMHLASLCSTPHLVWTNTEYYSAIGATNRRRYEKIWNPFDTKVTVLEAGWQPDVQTVIDAIVKELTC